MSGQGQEQCDDQARKKRSAKKRRSASRKRNSAKKKSRKEDEDDYDSKNPWEWTWSRASRAFAQLQGQTFGEVLDAVVSFASDDGGGGGGDGDGGGGFAPSSVRACALLTGVNLPDHDSLFRLLASKMRDKVDRWGNPTTNGGMQTGRSVGICTHFLPTCLLCRHLLTKFLHWSSVVRLLRVSVVGWEGSVVQGQLRSRL